MTKEKALQLFLINIYTQDSNLILTSEEIRKLNEDFKDTVDNNERYEEFLLENKSLISKLKSAKIEVKKQQEKGKALQPGILSECNYSETLAKMLGLNKCVDLESVLYKDIPKECIYYIQTSATTCSSGRYLYYNPDKNIYLFQYGNPEAGDAEVVIDGIKLKIEFKERIAKAGEYDITGLYDESGKLLISEKFSQNTPELVPFINEFNENTDVLSQIGSNYDSFDEDIKLQSIQEYFFRHHIDILITSTETNELIALTPECVLVNQSNGTKFISTENSEIRTTGRNWRKIFTNEFFNHTLKMMNAVEIDFEKYRVSLNNKYVELKKGRNKNTITKIKMNKVFSIRLENAIINNDENWIEFNRNDVIQAIPTISMHITVNATKEDLKNYYQDLLNQ